MFPEQGIFHKLICEIGVQMSRKTTYICTPLSSHSAKHQQRGCNRLKAKVYLYHPVRLSTCLSRAYTIY